MSQAIRATNQITIVDITDAYSVHMSPESGVFKEIVGSESESITATITATRGKELVSVTSGGTPTVTPTSGGAKVQLGSASGNALPVTITIDKTVKKSGIVTIPVIVDKENNGGVQFDVDFSYSVALIGADLKIKSQVITYATSPQGTETEGLKWEATIPSVSPGNFLWSRTSVTYTDDTVVHSYNVSRQGTNGTNGTDGKSITLSSSSNSYAISDSGTVTPSDWKSSQPAPVPGKFLWTKCTMVWSDGKSSSSYSVARQGEDTITVTLTSSAGTVFKNSQGSTTLTATIFKGGQDVTDTLFSGLLWKNEKGEIPGSKGKKSITVNAADVKSTAVYTVELV